MVLELLAPDGVADDLLELVVPRRRSVPEMLADDGLIAMYEALTARNQFVGLQGAFGTVKVGRHDTALKEAQGINDQLKRWIVGQFVAGTIVAVVLSPDATTARCASKYSRTVYLNFACRLRKSSVRISDPPPVIQCTPASRSICFHWTRR